MDEVRFAGQKVMLGRQEYIVPPLALGSLKTLLPKIQALQLDGTGTPDLSQVEDLLEICLAALKRNYPALTLTELVDVVDLVNFAPLIKAVMGQSGLVVTSEGNSAPGTVSP